MSDVEVEEGRERAREGEESRSRGGEEVGGELAVVREVVLRAYPDAVPELVSGGSVAELLASVEPARAAYARIAEAVGTPRGAEVPPVVPAGGTPAAVDPERLPTAEKIRRGLAGRGR